MRILHTLVIAVAMAATPAVAAGGIQMHQPLSAAPLGAGTVATGTASINFSGNPGGPWVTVPAETHDIDNDGLVDFIWLKLGGEWVIWHWGSTTEEYARVGGGGGGMPIGLIWESFPWGQVSGSIGATGTISLWVS